MNMLSASGLADLAGVTEAEVQRLVDLGVLVARDGAGPFLETDVQKVRLATACEQAGLPMDGIAAAIRDGRLSFAFLEAAPYRRWAVLSARTYRQVSQEAGVPLELLGSFLEAIGFARMAAAIPSIGSPACSQAVARRTFWTSVARNGPAPSLATRMPRSTRRRTSASVTPARSASPCADSPFMSPSS